MRWMLMMAVLLTTATLAICIISIAIPYWLYTDNPYRENQGLWQRCSRQESPSGDCLILKMPPEFLEAVRAMMMFGAILYTFATICALTFLCCKTKKTSLGTAATILSLFGGILCMIGVIVYGAKHDYLLYARGLELHAGFGLGVIAAIGGFVSTVFYCMSNMRGEID